MTFRGKAIKVAPLGTRVRIRGGDVPPLPVSLYTKYKAASAWIFASPFSKGRKPYWGQSLMSNKIRKVARGVGISKKIGWHTFRHTCATLLRASGADIKVVQELLRHASCRVTLDTYTQAVSEQKRAAQNKIAGMVRGTQATNSADTPRSQTL